MIPVLDLFSAAAGGWSLGMHRAGFTTVAACEAVEWRRILYNENSPGVPVYDDVRTLTADRLLRDIGELPSVIVGSPPCQDISSANTKGKGVEGERSGLYFEAVRLIGECRPRWFALENSANLRTRGADAVLSALEAIGYTCWPFVVRAGDIGANHERPRSWLIGCDLEQVADPNGDRWPAGRSGRRFRGDISAANHSCHTEEIGRGSGVPGRHTGATGREEQPTCGDAAHSSKAERRPNADQGSDRDGQASERQQGADRHAEPVETRDGDAADSASVGHGARPGNDEGSGREEYGNEPADGAASSGAVRYAADAHEDEVWQSELPGRSEPETPVAGQSPAYPDSQSEHAPSVDAEMAIVRGVAADREPRNTPDPDQARQAHGCMEPGLRQEEIADDGCGDGWGADRPGIGQMGLCPGDSIDPDGAWPLWSLDDLAARIRLDDGLPARVAGTRVAVGGPRGTTAASLIVEAYGDAVVPQIPEAIGRAILRVEEAMAAVLNSQRLVA